jgi:hypothetical protein
METEKGIVAVILGIAIAVWIFHRKESPSTGGGTPPSWPSPTPQRSRPSDTLKEGKQDESISARITGRAPTWDARHHRNHCDTIACSANGRAIPSTGEARGTGGGRSSSRRTPTTPLHTAPKFLPEKGREAGRTRCGGVKVNNT